MVLGLLMALTTAEAQAVEPVSQTDEAAWEHDVRLLAEARGWSYAEAVGVAKDEALFDDLVNTLADAYPSQFSSSVFAGEPGGVSFIYFKGVATSQARALVAGAGVSVVLVENGEKNADEWQQQSDEIVDWLLANGYTSLQVGFNDIDTIEVLVGNTRSPPDLPVHLADDVVVTSSTASVDLMPTIVEGGEEIQTTGPIRVCTSGWSVEDSSGTTGIVTCNHCSLCASYDRHEDAGAADTWTTAVQGDHYGRNGDMEWYTTGGTEGASFVADVDAIGGEVRRNVRDVRRRFSRGTSTCVFGRTTNDRNCYSVHRTSSSASMTCMNGLVLGVARRMVVTTSSPSANGDSGGGTSWGTTAHGIHTAVGTFNGSGPVRDWFTKANRVDNGLNVDILVTP